MDYNLWDPDERDGVKLTRAAIKILQLELIIKSNSTPAPLIGNAHVSFIKMFLFHCNLSNSLAPNVHLPSRRLWGISPVCGRSGRERCWNGTIHAKLKEGGIVICINCLGLNEIFFASQG